MPANARVQRVDFERWNDAAYVKFKIASRRMPTVAVLKSMDDSTLNASGRPRSWELSK